MTLPVFISAAGGGVLVDVDGNSLMDFGSGIAVVNVGNAADAVVANVSAQVAPAAGGHRSGRTDGRGAPGRLGGTYGGNPVACAAALGAMVAVELVQAGSLEPDPQTTKAVAAACHRQGLVVLTAGTYGNVLRFPPPLVIPDARLGEGLDILDAAFDHCAA